MIVLFPATDIPILATYRRVSYVQYTQLQQDTPSQRRTRPATSAAVYPAYTTTGKTRTEQKTRILCVPDRISASCLAVVSLDLGLRVRSQLAPTIRRPSAPDSVPAPRFLVPFSFLAFLNHLYFRVTVLRCPSPRFLVRSLHTPPPFRIPHPVRAARRPKQGTTRNAAPAAGRLKPTLLSL